MNCEFFFPFCDLPLHFLNAVFRSEVFDSHSLEHGRHICLQISFASECSKYLLKCNAKVNHVVYSTVIDNASVAKSPGDYQA